MYYLHLFSKKQPDLNWENEKVRQEVYDMMKFWCEKGIDGFRMDVISMISKDQRFPDGEMNNGLYGDFGPYCVHGPRVHEFLQEMNQKVLSKYDIMTVGETAGVTIEEAQKYAGDDRNELNMVFQFEHVESGCGDYGKWTTVKYDFKEFKNIMIKWQEELQGKAWNSLFLGNHDQPRSVSRFGNDNPVYRETSAKMLATCIHMMQGTPYVYQGEELGMTYVYFDKLEDYRDIFQYDWQDEILRTALQHNHNIRLTGGTEGVRYNASVSYYNQDGVLLNSGYERFQARANTVIKRDKLDISLTTNYSRSIQTGSTPSETSYSGMNNLFYSVWGYRPVTYPNKSMESLLNDVMDEDHIEDIYEYFKDSETDGLEDAIEELGGDYTEGNAWQYTWHVQHDVPGLIALFGGEEPFLNKLDSLFTLKLETTQADVTGLIGQYAHGNEPSHHVTYLYALAGRPERTQELIREIFDTQYSPKPNGLCGNDDCGQMSAWYMFSAMGFYPVNPVSGEYVFGAPQLPEFVLHLADGKTFTIKAEGLSEANKYVKSITLNGEPYTKNFISHADIVKGGTLVYQMTDKK